MTTTHTCTCTSILTCHALMTKDSYNNNSNNNNSVENNVSKQTPVEESLVTEDYGFEAGEPMAARTAAMQCSFLRSFLCSFFSAASSVLPC